MAQRDVLPPTRVPARATRSTGPGNWPQWAPIAAAIWGGLYAAILLGWALLGTTVPWKPDEAIARPMLTALAALAALAGTASMASVGRLPRARRRLVAAVLLCALVVFGIGCVGLPADVVGLLSLSGVDSVTGAVWVLFNAVGLGLLLPVALAHRRRSAGHCPRCGRAHRGESSGAMVRPPAVRASRRTQAIVLGSLAGLLPWAGVKTIWTLGGDALGVTSEGWREINAGGSAVATSLSSAGIDVTVMAALIAIVLAMAQLYRWGIVWPRWTLWLSGRGVPRLLVLVPAGLVGAALTLYGAALTVYAPLAALGLAPDVRVEAPFTTESGVIAMVLFGGLAFLRLVVGLRSYSSRTRATCVAALQEIRSNPAEVADV